MSVKVSTQCSTLYAEWLRCHGWNEGSLCALVRHHCICRLLRGSAIRCKGAQTRGWKERLWGGRGSCLANCHPWRLERRRHCRHGNLTEKSLRSGCCLASAATATKDIYDWQITSTGQHLNLEQAFVVRRKGYGVITELKVAEGRKKEEKLLLLQRGWKLIWGRPGILASGNNKTNMGDGLVSFHVLTNCPLM